MFTKFSTINSLNKAVNGTWARHNAITNNIANANTPGYKRMTVNFEDKLKESIGQGRVSLRTTYNQHIGGKSTDSEPLIKKEDNYSTRRDGNNVNIDVENAELAKNTIMYNALIRQISNQFNKWRMVINEGGK